MDSIIIAPIILFMVIVAPIWVIMHYRTAGKKAVGLSDKEQNSLNELANMAESMEDRITILESILDAESPDWRAKHGQ
ncbi:MAG: envelope stress response membrane protein PspB [Gammaproteobacteria bacterium]|nr:MAG: envelope stress response membrane protein PspB [Gammaproteobacteria bacterium]